MTNGQKTTQLGLAPGPESRRAALRSIARIDAAVRRDRQSAQRERWLSEVEEQLQSGFASVAKLLAEPGVSVAYRRLGPRIGQVLARIVEQRRRIAIGRVLHSARVENMLPERVAASQPVRFRDSDAGAIATARAIARRNPNPERTEPG